MVDVPTYKIIYENQNIHQVDYDSNKILGDLPKITIKRELSYEIIDNYIL